MGFESTFSAGERPQTYALDRTATGIGKVNIKHHKITETLCGQENNNNNIAENTLPFPVY